MRHRLSTVGIVLLMAIVVLGGVTGCQQSADKRSGDEATASPEDSGAPPEGTEEGGPAPGRTVVSVATPGSGSQPPAEPGATGESSGGESTTAPAGTDTPGDSSEPVATEPPPSGSTAPGAVHKVKSGETLYSIARMYGTTADAIARENNLTDPSTLQVGQELKIPGGSSSGGTSGGTSGGSTSGATGCRIRHTVKPGEWVWQIARNYGVSPYDILSANGLTINTARWVYPGQELCIP